MENNNGRGIFYGVMGVATLVVAIVGATFAYFAASANGTAGAAAANSANVGETLKVTNETKYIAPDLIPADLTTVKSSFAQSGAENTNGAKCRGASMANKENGNYGMCSYYTFTIENSSDVATQVFLSLKSDTNTFDTNLKYCVYTGNTTATKAATEECHVVPAVGEGNSSEFAVANLAAKTGGVNGSQEYTIVVYYENKNEPQNAGGAGKTFAGTITASTSSGEKVIAGYVATTQTGD